MSKFKNVMRAVSWTAICFAAPCAAAGVVHVGNALAGDWLCRPPCHGHSLMMADVLPNPLPSDMPLHRIGYEIVFEMLAASAAGAAAVRALVKKRWKWCDEATDADRADCKRKIDDALPKLRELMGSANCQEKSGLHSSGPEILMTKLEQIIRDDPDIRVTLNGVPIEWVYEALDPEGWESACKDFNGWFASGEEPFPQYDEKRELTNKLEERQLSCAMQFDAIARNILERQRRAHEKRNRRLRIFWFTIALVVSVITAWLLGRYV